MNCFLDIASSIFYILEQQAWTIEKKYRGWAGPVCRARSLWREEIISMIGFLEAANGADDWFIISIFLMSTFLA